MAVGPDAFSGWWRVDPKTGHTLGLGSTGWGQEYVEYLITIALDMQLAYALCKLYGGSDGNCLGDALIAGALSILFSFFALAAMRLAAVAKAARLPFTLRNSG